MADVLTISNLCKSFKDFELSNMNLRVVEGGVTGFIGSNGAGKTTTIKLILGLMKPTSGSVELFGETIGPEGPSATIKQRIGVVFDTCPFPTELRIANVGELGARCMPAWDKTVFDAFCEQFSLPPIKQVKELSRGMSMKLQLAYALAHHPQLLILDEATAGLDPLAREEVLELLRGYIAEGNRGILISSHITSDLEKIADWIVCVDQGRLVFEKTTEEICDLAGIARCRASEAAELIESGLFAAGSLHVLQRGYSTDVLVPDRAALRAALPDITCDRASIEDYMALVLEGQCR